jgi:putative tricarboxylic transport membrane protein
MMKMFKNLRMGAIMLTLIVSICSVSSVMSADKYPTRPLEIVAPANPGGGWDSLARTINRTLEIEKLFPQPMAVVNKPGGGGAVGLAYMFNKKGDDNELVVYSPPLIILTLNKQFTQNYKELTPLAKLVTDYQIFIVKKDSPYKTFKDLIAALKKDPKNVKFAGGSAPGSMDHLAFCKVAKAAGVDVNSLTYVAFSGGGDALVALLGGNVAFVSSGIGEMIPQIQAGTVRALAVTSPARLPGVMKNVPTVKELGINATYEVWRGVFGAPGMSKEAQAFWATTLKKMVTTKTWNESIAKLSLTAAYADSAAFTKFLADDEKAYKELMTALGFIK